MTAQQPSSTTDGTDTEANGDDDSQELSTRTIKYLYWGGLALAGFMAFLSVIQFYLNASAAIDQVISDDYQSLFQAGFNLIILLASGIAISTLVRRLSADGETTPGDRHSGSLDPGEWERPEEWRQEETDEESAESESDADPAADTNPDHVTEIDLGEETDAWTGSDAADETATTDWGDDEDTAATDWGGSDES